MTTFCFIAGLHRSGTSVLARSLGEHTQVSGFQNTGVIEDEGQFLQSVYPAAREFGGPGRFGFDPRSHLDETSDLATSENAVRMFREWRDYWDTNKTVLLEKSPPNLLKTRFLQRVFPDTKFVVILRHPIATSLATQNWSRTTLESLIEHWLICHERFMLDRKLLQHCEMLRYESFVSHPEVTLQNVQRFLQLPIEPLGTEVSSGHNERYFNAWSIAAQDPKLGEMIAACQDKFEKRVRKFGYTLDLTQAPSGVLPSLSQYAA